MHPLQPLITTMVSKSPAARRAALRLPSFDAPFFQRRYNSAVERALSDPEATFTEAERRALAASTQADSAGRQFVLRVRLTNHEHRALMSYASARGMTMSEVVRQVLPLHPKDN